MRLPPLLLFLSFLLPVTVAGASAVPDQAPAPRVVILFALEDFSPQHLKHLQFPILDALREAEVLEPGFNDIYLLADPAQLEGRLRNCTDPVSDPGRCARLDPLARAFLGADKAPVSWNSTRLHLLPPTRKALLSLLESLSNRLGNESELLLQLHTHGTLLANPVGRRRLDSRNVAYATQDLITSDKDGSWQTPLTQEDLLAALDPLRGRTLALIETTCHDRLPSRGDADVLSVSRSTVVISDSSPGEPSYEDSLLGGGIFTHFFVEALRAPQKGARFFQVVDTNNDGVISLDEAYVIAAQETWLYSRERTNHPIRPTRVDQRTLEPLPFVLVGPPSQADSSTLYFPELDEGSFVPRSELKTRGWAVALDGAELSLDAPGGIPIAPGPHRVTLTTDGGERTRFRVQVASGSRLTLGQLRRLSRQRHQLRLNVGALSWLEQDAPWRGLGLETTFLRPVLLPPRGAWMISAGVRLRLASDRGCEGNTQVLACAEGSLGSAHTLSWLAQGAAVVELERVLRHGWPVYGSVGLTSGPLYYTLVRLDGEAGNGETGDLPGYASSGVVLLTGAQLGLEHRRAGRTLRVSAELGGAKFSLVPVSEEAFEAPRLHLLGQLGFGWSWRF